MRGKEVREGKGGEGRRGEGMGGNSGGEWRER